MERARLASPSDETDYIHRMKRREGIWPSRKEQKLDEFVEFLDRQSARSRDFEQGETHNFFTWENSQNRDLTLKQARRRFCINHASEAAAMRKMSRPKVSDAAAVEKFQAAVMAMAEKSLTEEKRNLQEMPEQRRAAFSRLFRLKEQTLRNEELRRRTTNKADNKKHRLKGKVSDEIEACEATGYEGETENRRIREKGESSQSSKSSRGDRSCSTSNSGESISSEKGSKPHMSKDVRWRAIRRVEMNQGRIRLKNFNLLRRLGCGDIGTVYVAQLVGSDYLFALKVMDEEFLWNRQKMPRAETEREILQMLDHPFLPTLYSHFSEDNLACLVMEYCPGGDLHALRQRKPLRSFPEPAARFYAAEVLLALEYLHMLGVIYRDLKPENILVREDGHVMLSDFDLSLRCSVSPVLLECTRSFETQADESPAADTPCSVSCLPASGKSRSGDPANSMPMLVAEPTEARSNSFVGTHEYLAPEIVKGDGHGSSVDWWTLGIFLYELLFGTTPFKGRDNEETLSNIVEMNLSFPESFEVTTQVRDLIRGLLVKDPEKRIGSVRGAAEIKRHRFFDGLNWALIRSAIPPETPADDDDLVLPRAYATPAMACGKKQGRCLDLWNDRSQFGLF